jgi:8-oxo-dGTP diphosphatase
MAMNDVQKLITQVGVGVIIKRDNEILLLRRRNVHGDGTWSTPGGHMEFGESPEQCAVREAYEETGLRVGQVRFRGLTNDVFETEGKHYITIWMESEYEGGEAQLTAEYESAQLGWFRLDALPAPLFLPFRNLLEERTINT